MSTLFTITPRRHHDLIQTQNMSKLFLSWMDTKADPKIYCENELRILIRKFVTALFLDSCLVGQPKIRYSVANSHRSNKNALGIYVLFGKVSLIVRTKATEITTLTDGRHETLRHGICNHQGLSMALFISNCPAFS